MGQRNSCRLLLLVFLGFQGFFQPSVAQLQPPSSSWLKQCSERENFLKEHLQEKNYLSAESLLEEWSESSTVDLIILSEAHYQPSMSRQIDFLRQLSETSNINCLFVEATPESWADDQSLAESFGPDHPLHFIAEFFEDLEKLPLQVHLVDTRERLDQWLSTHFSPLPPEELEELAREELSYRNRVMSRRIAEALSEEGPCERGVMLVGPNHLSRFSRGTQVASLRDLLVEKGVSLKALLLMDSELMLGLDYSLDHSISSPALCFRECSYNPELPQKEVAFLHRNAPWEMPPLLDVGRVDPHFGARFQGSWSDFDATVIFPPLFIRTCEERRGF